MTVNDEGHTILSAEEEIAFQLGTLFLVPMGLSFSIVILFILFSHLKAAKKIKKIIINIISMSFKIA